MGRDPQTLGITVGVTVRYGAAGGAATPCLSGMPADVAQGLAAHADAGVDHVVAALEPATAATLSEFADAVALFRARRQPPAAPA